MNLLSRTLTAALLLTVLVAGISAQRSQRSIRANSARRPQPAASPSPGVLLSSEQWQIDDVEPVEAIRGERVTVTGKFPEKLTGIEVVLNKIEVASAPATRATPTPTPTSSTPCTKTMAATTGRLVNDAASFAFVVPPCTRLGRYSVIVKFSQGGRNTNPSLSSEDRAELSKSSPENR